MEKILSVSIAAYNVASTLHETIESFINSGEMDALDIIIVNDESTDNTEEIANCYIKKYPESIRLINKKNGGWGSTVNTGIERSLGKYFRQVDGDDHYSTGNMSAYIEVLRNSNSDMIISPYISYDDASGEILSHDNCNPGYELYKEYQLEDIKDFGPFMHSIAVKTELVRDTVRITEKCFYTDTEFALKACNQVKTVMFIDLEVYCYRRAATGQSMSLSGLEKHYLEQYKVIQVLLEYKNNSVNREEVNRIFDKLLFGTCWWHYMVMLYIEPTRKHKHDLIAYDKMLKKEAPEYYSKVDWQPIVILRKSHFWGYAKIAKTQKAHDNRFSKDGRLLS